MTARDLDLVASIHVLPWWNDGVVLLRSSDSGWEIPGGTREPGESLDDCLARELREEIGGVAGAFRTIGAVRCTNDSPYPFRPHIPHPQFNVLVGEVALVRLAAELDLDENEHHIERGVLPALDALDLLAGEADMLALSRILRDAVGSRSGWAIPDSN
ncbi:MAG TPA: NUDIX domain-containing protein [Terrimesophilobacter sp.]|nr:NUDIX domain-containing protein [Terrimesophilobacter sp.]